MSNLIAQLRSLARFEHADLSIGDEAADALELAAVVEEERAHFTRLCMDHERAMRAIVRAASLAKAHRIAGNALARILDKGVGKPPTFAGPTLGRYECPTCGGGGEVAPDFECPDCDGTGYCVPPEGDAP